MEKEYNIIIIGTGTAGRTFADKVSRSVLKLDEMIQEHLEVFLLQAAVTQKSSLLISQGLRTGVISL